MSMAGGHNEEDDLPKIRKSIYEVGAADGKNKGQKEGEKKNNLWKTILSDVAQRDGLKDSWLLMLGDKGCGKRSLVKEINSKHILGRNSKLPVEKMGSDFAALDFSFLYCKDLSDKEQRNVIVDPEDNTSKLNVLTVADSQNMDLVETVLKPAYLENLVVAIVLDLDQPWDLMQSLQKWMKALQSLLFRILPEMQPGLYEKMKKKLVDHWKLFEEPQLDDQGNLIKKLVPEKAEVDSEGEQMEPEEDVRLAIELPEGVLKVNLGVPIVVVVQKVDVLLHGDKRQFLEQNLDFIQKHIREYCLQYGAAVVFTSANSDRNLDVFYQYLVHRLYSYDFKYSPEIIERDNLFLPAGFDSHNLIDQLSKAANIATEDVNGKPILYEDVIAEPSSKSGNAQSNRNSVQKSKIEECADWNSLLLDKI